MANFYDHFSGHAELYSRHRPTYPEGLFTWLVEHGAGRERAWDCATGGGQAALGLADHFVHVVATDASRRQLAHAASHPCVAYVLAAAEAAPLADKSVDLITVAQALHWLRSDPFYSEVERVSRPGALLAAWSYQLFSIDQAVDAVMERFYYGTLDPFWPPQRAHVRDHYRSLPFPFPEVDPPRFVMRPQWSRTDLLNQVSTWSAVRRHDAATGISAVDLLATQLEQAWPVADQRRPVEWTINMRVGRVGP